MKRKLIALSMLLCLLLGLLAGCGAALDDVLTVVLDDIPEAADTYAAPAQTPQPAPEAFPAPEVDEALDPEGSYTTREDVSLYLRTYGELPPNFITKRQARALGWSGGGLEDYAPGKCIGGDVFGNYEGILPDEGQTYHECDIDTLGASSRGAKRLVYSDDGFIYYTDDHYESFTQIWPEE